MKSILIKILYFLIISLILYNVCIILQSIVYPEDTPSFLGFKTFTIITGSMSPNIEVDDIVITKEVRANELNRDDIISFKNGENTVTHRIVDIQETEKGRIFTTKGDGNDVSDLERVRYDQIEGKYIGRIPKAGIIMEYFKNKYVFGGIVALLGICYVIQNKRIEKKTERKIKRRKLDRYNSYEKTKEKEKIDLAA